MAELDLVRRLACLDGHRERDLQHLVPLVPLHKCLETQHTRTGVKGHALEQPRLAESAPKYEQSTMSAPHLNLLDRGQLHERVAVHGVAGPGVLERRSVVV